MVTPPQRSTSSDSGGGQARRGFPLWGRLAIPAGILWGTAIGGLLGMLFGNLVIGLAIGAGIGVGAGLAVFAAAVVVASASLS